MDIRFTNQIGIVRYQYMKIDRSVFLYERMMGTYKSQPNEYLELVRAQGWYHMTRHYLLKSKDLETPFGAYISRLAHMNHLT